MTENVEDQVNFSQTSGSEQQTPHFLRDVIFHGKFKVSVSARDTETDRERVGGQIRQDK